MVAAAVAAAVAAVCSYSSTGASKRKPETPGAPPPPSPPSLLQQQCTVCWPKEWGRCRLWQGGAAAAATEETQCTLATEISHIISYEAQLLTWIKLVNHWEIIFLPKFLHSGHTSCWEGRSRLILLQNCRDFQYCPKGPDILIAFSMFPILDTNLWSKPYFHFQKRDMQTSVWSSNY